MEYRLLGHMVVRADGRDLAVGGIKQRAVLAILLLNAGSGVDLDTLVDLVWDDTPPAKPISSVRAYVANLRRTLADGDPTGARALVTDATGYRLDVAPDELDIATFERLTTEGRQALTVGDATRAEESLRVALDLWRGPALFDFRDHRFADAAVHRFSALRTMAAEGLYEAGLQLGRDAELIPGLEEQVRIDPLHERLWGQLMVALYRSGRRAEALATYQRARTVLDDELGVAPGAALEHLRREITRESAELDYAPLRLELRTAVVDTPRNHRIVGRDRELSVLAELVATTPRGHGAMTVIRGDSGTGKSSMAAAVVDDALEQGFVFAWSTQTDGVREPPMWTWVHIVDRLVEYADPDDVARARVFAPEILSTRGPASVGATTDPTVGSRFEDAEKIATVIVTLVGATPTVLVLDDLHRADRPTREVLEVLSHRLREVPLLVVVTWQDAGPDRPLRPRAFDRLLSRSDTVTIRLGPLAPDAVGELVTVETRVRAHPDLVAAIHERTGGNPFHTRELARLLHTGGHLDADTRRIDIDVPPDAVAGVVRRRLAGLSRRTRDALGIGALLGVVVESALLAEVLDLSDSELRERLGPACRIGILTPSAQAPQRYWFTHAVIRHVSADDLPVDRREWGHARIAGAYAARADVGAYDQTIAAADHAWRAGEQLQPEVAAGLIDRALQHSVTRAEYQDIADLTEHALDMAQRLPRSDSRLEREARHWMQRASVLAVLEGHTSTEAAEALARAFEVGSAMSPTSLFTSAVALRCAMLVGTAAHREAAALGEGLIAKFDADGDPAAGAAGYYVRAVAELMRGEPAAAIATVDRLHARVPAVPARDNLLLFDVRAFGVAALAHATLGDAATGRAMAHNGIALARSRSNAFAEAIISVNALQVNAFCGVVAGTAAEAEQLIETLNRAGAKDLLGSTQIIAEWARGMAVGGPDTTVGVRDGIALHTSGGMRIFAPFYLRLLAEVENVHGHLDDARASIHRAELMARTTGEIAWEKRPSVNRGLRSTDGRVVDGHFSGNAG
ncbi:BREX system ATP-binding domain-containing protein [Williamsia sp.]|uniref:BREX system ATP-binding domain-containing protein n=1 Tax=Williamsia sp. TaxID=1872085 RepID=UPI001A2908CB|nr:BREX system ATP-binding domain-containing protein [Williamsia sp.]MBJ7289785.1 DUF2791 family P-loop domain-containing protein [Williamsia sp.]